MRSYLATGNPLFPFLNSLFAQSGAAHGSFSVSSFERTDYPRNLAGYLGYFWHLTMDYWDQRPWFLAIHPAYLAFLPFAIIWAVFPPRTSNGVKWLQILRYLLVLAFLTLTINFFLAPAYPRYLFPTWFCLSLTSAWVLMEILRRWKPVGMVIVPIALLLPFLIVLGMGAKRAIEVLPQYWSEPARVEAIREAFPGYDTFIWANEHLDPGRDKVLSIDPKTYYLKAPAIIAKPGIESPLLVPWDSEPSKILANWRELGATYFVLDTTLLSVKHGFAISFFTDVLDGRDAVWLDIVSTRAGADFYGIGDILTDSEFLYMSKLAGLPVVNDGTIDRHFFTRDDALRFQSWGRDWLMARTVLRFVRAGILREEHRSGPGGGLRIYSIHLPTSDDIALPALPDVTAYCLPYESGPQLDDPNVRDVQ
jgi:hypothetical protein